MHSFIAAAAGKKPKKKLQQQQMTGGQIVSLLIYLPIGIVCGFILARLLDSVSLPDIPDGLLIAVCCAFAGLVFILSMFLQTIIHELGHMVFGLLTGYRFGSFRIGKLTLLRNDEGKLILRRYSLAGTAGQCLMFPPKVEKDFPYVLYNLGGALFNFIFSALAGLGAWLLGGFPFLSAGLAVFALVGFALGIVNGLPLRIGAINNDGRNILDMSRMPEALDSFRRQLIVNELSTRGVRMRDMPADLFVFPSDEGMNNSLAAAMGVFCEQRLMDEGRFNEALELIERMTGTKTDLTDNETGKKNDLIGMYVLLLQCDRLCCELFCERRPEVISQLREVFDSPMMNTMGSYISVMRTRCVDALLSAAETGRKTEKLLAKFEKLAASHPYTAEAESEREFVELAKKLAGAKAE